MLRELTGLIKFLPVLLLVPFIHAKPIENPPFGAELPVARWVNVTSAPGVTSQFFRPRGTQVGPLMQPTEYEAFIVNPNGSITPEESAFEREVKMEGVNPTPRVKCHLSGTLAAGVPYTTFVFSDGRHYLSRCGAQDGITVTCEGPGPECDGR